MCSRDGLTVHARVSSGTPPSGIELTGKKQQSFLFQFVPIFATLRTITVSNGALQRRHRKRLESEAWRTTTLAMRGP